MKTKEQYIIEAAVRLFSEKGYTATSVDEIAKESGMAKASFYKFFQSKEDVLVATIVEHGRVIGEMIERLYAATDQSPEQRLSSFIELQLNNVMESKIHSIMVSLHDKSILQNEKLLHACLQVEYSTNQWCTDCLNRIYGSEVDPYVYDIIFMVRALLMQFMFLPIIGIKPQISIDQLSQMLTRLVDQMVTNMIQVQYQPIWNWQNVEMSPDRIEQSPVFQGILIHELLLGIKRTLPSLEIAEDERTELWQVLSSLEEEITRMERRSGLIRAMLEFLKSYNALNEYASKLQHVLSLR
ncbi:helix-turn-helix domain-containing protein [Paenibacillus campi]|uniref:TetR/AcrR family transcriptional regulator n=1 Tax=Paenibacillus campi TaxID=3106031 RepID=UPI002B003C1B|nr:helix-turn-helix domain-containing protein [Paenibacillus sp. SGZ-1014]